MAIFANFTRRPNPVHRGRNRTMIRICRQTNQLADTRNLIADKRLRTTADMASDTGHAGMWGIPILGVLWLHHGMTGLTTEFRGIHHGNAVLLSGGNDRGVRQRCKCDHPAESRDLWTTVR